MQLMPPPTPPSPRLGTDERSSLTSDAVTVCVHLRDKEEELICRCVSFIMKSLNSCNSVVHSVSRNGIYGMRMLSPIGANVQFCCNYYGMSPNDIPYVNKRSAWTVIAPDLDKINLIKELLSVKFHEGQISLFCESEVDFMIWFLCTS